MAKLKCPKCPLLHLGLRTIGTLNLNCCDHCGGVWVETSQIAAVSQLTAEELALLPEPRRDMSLDDMKIGKCPIDKDRLEHQLFKEGSRLVVDRCCQCQGIWFDGGELASVQEA